MRTINNKGIDYLNMLDSSIRPQDDFFGYVNNKWLEANPIPDNETRWGIFISLFHQTLNDLRDIYKTLPDQNLKPGSIEQIASDFYQSGIHFSDFKDKHISIINDYCEQINVIKDKKDLWGMLGELHNIDIDGVWGIVVDADDKNSSRHIFRIQQPSLTLPNRDYYLDQSATMKQVRGQYQTHVKKLFSFFPILADNANDFWDIIWKFEHGLAKISRPSSDLRNVRKNYHKTTFAKLKLSYPLINWDDYAKGVGWQPRGYLSVDQPEVLAYVNQLVNSYTLEEWKTYLKWSLIINYYGTIDKQFAQLRFDFFGKVLGGAKTMLPLWKRVISRLNTLIGEDIGQLYVKKYFPASSKKQILDMVEDMRLTYAKRLKSLDWMSDPSKQLALKKLANIHVLIGYPDKWRSFKELNISRESYLGNILSATKFQNAYYLNKLDQPISRDEWFMSPQTINAYNDPSRLVICFPAAILQPPFFDPKANLAINLGGIGSVICHELTHAFDDEGCQFDEQGNVRPWQTNAERKAFAKRAQVIIKQADNFEVLPGLNLNGKLVIGESIADLGGLEIAYDTLCQQLKSKVNQAMINGLTASQLFYINYAITECVVTRESRSRELVLSNPHPDEKFRVNGIIAHCDGFYRAFQLKPGDKLYLPPNQRVKIW
ncbi:MAG: M13 family metallopeptidase [Candidatus Saccharimonadales bacterium]